MGRRLIWRVRWYVCFCFFLEFKLGLWGLLFDFLRFVRLNGMSIYYIPLLARVSKFQSLLWEDVGKIDMLKRICRRVYFKTSPCYIMALAQKKTQNKNMPVRQRKQLRKAVVHGALLFELGPLFSLKGFPGSHLVPLLLKSARKNQTEHRTKNRKATNLGLQVASKKVVLVGVGCIPS